MTTLFTSRRRAEEFAAAVDGAPSRASHGEVARLVGVVTALRAHEEVLPRPEFAADLRARLVAEAHQVLTSENAGLALPPRTRGPRERRLVAAASTLVLIGGTAGMAAAAQDALPGEALYPIKRGIEKAEAGLNMSEAGRGRDLLAQANDRLAEVEGLLAEDPVQARPQIPGTLDEFRVQAIDGANLLLSSFQETRDPSAVDQVRSFAAQGIDTLESLAADLPADAQDELHEAALALRDIDERATAVCSTCAASLPDLQIPGLILARSEVDRALRAAAPALLDNSHPVVVPKGTVSKKGDRSQPDGNAQGEAGQTGQPGQLVPAPDQDNSPAPEDAPDLEVDPNDLQTPALPGEEPTAGEDVTKKPKKVVEDLTDELTGVVETLLPETGNELDDLLP